MEVEEENEVDFTQRQNSTSVFTIIDEFLSSTVTSIWPMVMAVNRYCEPAIEMVCEFESLQHINI